MNRALVVGAGFAGATAARELAEADWKVTVVDKRSHIGGNAFDFVNGHGIRVHLYGPHLWHTSNDEVQQWASRFTEWVPYKHRVKAQLNDGRYVPLPINPETLEKIFDSKLWFWATDNDYIAYDPDTGQTGYKKGAHAAFLETLVEHHQEVTNSRQHVENSVGRQLCDLFFAPYTKKMWGLELEQLPAAVAARIPTNVESGSELYFPKDKHQYLPKDGYTAMFERIFDHPNITVVLNHERREVINPHLRGFFRLKGVEDNTFDVTFTSEPIDTYFDCRLGELPWRSIRMHTQSVPVPYLLPTPVVNFTHAGPFTRVTEWKQLPAHGDNPHWTTITTEEPCDYKDNGHERYYPVKTSNEVCPNRELYQRYVELARQEKNVHFIGRCGRYVYTDMAPCISSTLSQVRRFLRGQNTQVDD